VTGDANQLQQAIVNLVVNARDAMPDGGTITVGTADVEVDAAGVARYPQVAEGGHVLISVGDTGSGIPPEIVGRIFDPFFTTKEQGRGTGLGLSMVLGTVKAAGGSIAVDSEPGRGTTFRIYLPRTEEPATPVGWSAAADRPGIGAGRTVLVVEDEDVVRSFAIRVLDRAGFTILEARDGTEAVDLVARYAGPLDLVLTDVVMPGPSGPATVERIRALRPGVPALFVTGYSGRPIPMEPSSVTAVLPKPYSSGDLLEQIEALLRDAGEPRDAPPGPPADYRP
jgi:two-component system cell cycle sensor histidine kinase/response regulator CckA